MRDQRELHMEYCDSMKTKARCCFEWDAEHKAGVMSCKHFLSSIHLNISGEKQMKYRSLATDSYLTLQK